MCGITGIIAFNEEGEQKLGGIHGAVNALAKRGPDGNGVFRHKRVGLGHTRLSIIDVSSNGAQPFHDKTDRFTIVFNGEIFNFLEHRSALEKQGVLFSSRTDTEVLLELYIREKEKCLDKLNGFFAFAIYDRETQETFIARDRYGVKPLLVYRDASILAFASEMKSLVSFDIQKKLDHNSLFDYLHLNYIPGPHSIFEGVKKLLPGHWMKVKDGKIIEQQWYHIPEKQISPLPSYEQAQDILVQKLDAAVERRLISDVPLGAFLSGGIDSSAIVALASRHTKHLSTFSIGYKDEPLFDETKYAKLVADKYKTEHTVFSLTNKDLFNHLHDVLDYIDEPFADSSALAVYILSRETRKHVTVALSGDGADELFGGYMKHLGEWNLRNGGWKAGVVSLLGPLWNVMPKSRNSSLGNTARKLDKFSKGLKMDPKDRYWQWCGYADKKYLEEMPAFGVNELEARSRKSFNTRFIGETNTMNDVLKSDMHLVLPGDMLTKVDLMSMANSLEVRTPFLDVEVVDFAFGLPANYKVSGRGRKLIVQDAFRKLLPEELYHRPKHGFEVPLLNWFRNELNSWIFGDLLSPSFLKEQGLFNVEAVNTLKNELHSADPGDATARLWGLIVFQSWYNKTF